MAWLIVITASRVCIVRYANILLRPTFNAGEFLSALLFFANKPSSCAWHIVLYVVMISEMWPNFAELTTEAIITATIVNGLRYYLYFIFILHTQKAPTWHFVSL